MLKTSLSFLSLTVLSLYADTPSEDDLFKDSFLEELTSQKPASQDNSSKEDFIVDDWTNPDPNAYSNKASTPAPSSKEMKYPSQSDEVFAAQPFVRAGSHFSVYGNYLYWVTGANNTTYTSQGNNTGSVVTRSLSGLKGKYSSGSRLGIAGAFQPQGWDLDLVWTRLHQDITSTAYNPNDGVNSLFITWGSAYNAGTTQSAIAKQKANWKFHFDELDLSFGRGFFVSKFFSLRPNFGFRQVWINDGLMIKNNNSSNVTICSVQENNSFKAFGIKTGLDSAFHLGWGFSIDSLLNIALVYGKNKVSYTPSSSTTTTFASVTATGNSTSESFNSLVPIVDVGASLNWADTFFDETLGVSIGAGYEYHILIDGFVPVSVVNNNGIDINIERPTSLYMNGLTVSLELGF